MCRVPASPAPCHPRPMGASLPQDTEIRQEAQGEKGEQREGVQVRLHATVEALRPTLQPQAPMAPNPPGGVDMAKIVFGLIKRMVTNAASITRRRSSPKLTPSAKGIAL